jgi:hypothetical protein
MDRVHQELGFDTLLVIASGMTLAVYMLGILLDPIPAAVIGFILVAAGVMTIVPRRTRATAAALGFVTFGLAGIVVPRAVTWPVASRVGSQLTAALAGSGLVLLFGFALLRLTVFRDRSGKPA